MSRRAQSTIEAAGVLPIIITAIIGMAAFLAFVGQGWALGQLSAYVGTTLISTGQLDFDRDGALDGGIGGADYTTFFTKANLLNSSFSTSTDTLTIVVEHLVSGESTATATYSFGKNGSTSMPEVEIAYGDLVRVSMSRDFAFGAVDAENDLFGVLTRLTTVTSSWSGVAQRDTAGTAGEGSTGPSNDGYLLVTVTDSNSAAIEGAKVEIGGAGSPDSGTDFTDAQGKASISITAGTSYPLSVTAAGYQTYSNYVDITAGLLTNVGVSLDDGTDLSVSVTIAADALTNTNGTFETEGSAWTTGSNAFVAPALTFDYQYEPTEPREYVHAGDRSGRIVTSTTASEGIYKSLSGTYTSGTVYTASVWVNGPMGANVALLVGSPAVAHLDFAYKAVTLPHSGWTQITLSSDDGTAWTPSADRSDVIVAIRANNGQNTSRTIYVDDFTIVKASALQDFCNVSTNTGLTSASTTTPYLISVTNGQTYSVTATCPIVPANVTPTNKDDAWDQRIGTRSGTTSGVYAEIVEGGVPVAVSVE